MPSTVILPESGTSRWLMQRSRVDLPEPLGPMITATCPCGDVQDDVIQRNDAPVVKGLAQVRDLNDLGAVPA